jgi:hypothetical protein
MGYTPCITATWERTFVAMPASWRRGFQPAYTHPEPEPEGPGLVGRETSPDYWSGSWGSQPRGTVMLETSCRWVAYVRLEDPPGLSPITTVGRFDTADEAQVATDEVWAAR